MAYSDLMIEEVDRGNFSAQVVLRLQLADMELYMLTEERAAATTDSAKGAAIIKSISETNYAARISAFDSGDQVPSMIVEALNATMPIHSQNANIPKTFQQGKLSDYLMQSCLAGPTSGLYAFRPAQAQLYMAPHGEQLADLFYLFKGVLDRFEVTEEGAVVVMTFVSDTRWQRSRPYSMHRKNLKLLPQESIGQDYPIAYGQHALWHHKDFPKNGTVGDGPCDKNMPLFPVCMSVAPTICSARYKQHETNYQWDSEYLISRHTLPPTGLDEGQSTNTRALVVPVASNLTAIVRPAYDTSFRTGTKFKTRGFVSTEYSSDVGIYDPSMLGVAQVQDKYQGTAQILPLKRIDSSQGSTDNLAAIFGADHRRIGPQNMIDGDRWTWFRDDSAITTDPRVVIFELGGTYPNLGAMTSLRFLIAAQRVSGTGNLIVYPWLDYSSIAQVTGSTTLTPNARGFAHGVVSFSTDPVNLALQLQRWEFNQVDVTPNVPMKLRIGWSKVISTSVWNIIHVALLAEFNPSRQFLEKFEERIVDRTVSYYDYATGRYKTKVVQDHYMIPLYGDRVPEPMRNVFYMGWANGTSGQVGAEKVWTEAPDTWKTLQNPAFILKDAMLYYGGGYRSDVPGSWPAIHDSQFETGGTPHDWDQAAADLNDAVNETNNTTDETFKQYIGFSKWNGTRELSRAICGAVPGLRVVEYPRSSTLEPTARERTSWGCLWPITGRQATYRRRVNLRTDTLHASFALTPRDHVINDLRLRYGHSVQKGTYCRELWCSELATEHGMPIMTQNSGAQNISDVRDSLSTSMNTLASESFEMYGSKSASFDLPFTFRWHEALAIRTWLLRWFAFQRCRLTMVVNVHVLDLEIGDRFQLDEPEAYGAQPYFECQPPVLQFPGMSGMNWHGLVWQVDEVSYLASEMGMVLAKVSALNVERYGGW